MGDLLVAALIVVAVAVTIVKRFVGEPLEARELFITPLVLVGIGVHSLTQVDAWSVVDVVWVPLGCVIGFAFGAVRGTTTVLFTKDEVLHQRYTVRTAVVWAVSLVVGAGVGLLGSALGVHEGVRPIVLSIGVGLLGEMVTTGVRALSTGKAFAVGRTDDSSSIDRALSRLTTARSAGELDESPTFRASVRRLIDNAH